MNTREVAMFFFRPRLGAGSTTFTAHLYRAFELSNLTPTIYRVTEQDRSHLVNPFGDYKNMRFKSVSMENALRIVRSTASIMTAIAKPPHVRDQVPQRLMEAGMRAVVHDSNEAKNYDWNNVYRPIVIRKALTEFQGNFVYLPHPYERVNKFVNFSEKREAVSLARTSAAKRTSMILEANKLLATTGEQIKLLGMQNQVYAKSIGLVLSAARFPMGFKEPVKLCDNALTNTDLSWFEKDGGGTQYSQLEAMDAGAVNIMHEDWFRYKDDLIPGKHVLTVSSAQDLADLVRVVTRSDAMKIYKDCEEILRIHSAAVLGKVYYEEILR